MQQRKLGKMYKNHCHRLTVPMHYINELGWKAGDVLNIEMKEEKIVVTRSTVNPAKNQNSTTGRTPLERNVR